jgi:hypothetical protein
MKAVKGNVFAVEIKGKVNTTNRKWQSFAHWSTSLHQASG